MQSAAEHQSYAIVQLTDAGVSALGAGCGQLQSIDLSYCCMVTDAGVLALVDRCSQLQRYNLTCCDKVTDAGLSLLRSRNELLVTTYFFQ